MHHILQLQGHPEAGEVHAGQADRRAGDRKAAPDGDRSICGVKLMPQKAAAQLFRRGLHTGELRRMRQLPASEETVRRTRGDGHSNRTHRVSARAIQDRAPGEYPRRRIQFYNKIISPRQAGTFRSRKGAFDTFLAGSDPSGYDTALPV